MSESTNCDNPQIEVISDEDWKSRVKEEDAKLDAERAGQARQTGSEAHASEAPPPASFSTLLQMLSTQAIVAMGLVPLPDGKSAKHFPMARHFIDLLAVLAEKCQGNLSPHESKFLDNTLHELRMAYIEVTRQNEGR